MMSNDICVDCLGLPDLTWDLAAVRDPVGFRLSSIFCIPYSIVKVLFHITFQQMRSEKSVCPNRLALLSGLLTFVSDHSDQPVSCPHHSVFVSDIGRRQT